MDITLGIRRQRPKNTFQTQIIDETEVWNGRAILASKENSTFNLEPITQEAWPRELTLDMSWRGIPIDNPRVIAQCIVGGQSLNPCEYYVSKSDLGIHSRVKSVALDYTGAGSIQTQEGKTYFQGTEINNDWSIASEPSFIKEFIQQNVEQLVSSRVMNATGDWVITPPKKPELAGEKLGALLGYGAYARPGVTIDQIEQVYGIISHGGGETILQLWRSTNLMQLGFSIVAGGSYQSRPYVFIEQEPIANHKSLCEAIRSGHFTVRVKCGDEVAVYKSCDYVTISKEQQMFTMKFIQVEGEL